MGINYFFEQNWEKSDNYEDKSETDTTERLITVKCKNWLIRHPKLQHVSWCWSGTWVRSTQGQTTEEVDTEDRVSYRIYCSLSVRAAVLHKAG